MRVWGKSLIRYIREHRGSILLFIAVNLIYFLMFYLYQLEMEALFYGFVLSLFVFLLYHILQGLRMAQKATERKQLLEPSALLWQELPKPHSLAEEDYQKMVISLRQHCSDISAQWEEKQKESLDYYTTWVHQIKIPITVMQMQLAMEDTEEHRALLVELFRIQEYVNMALGYVRLDGEAKDLVLQKQDVDHMVREVIHKFAPQFIRKKLRLDYEPVHRMMVTDEKWFCFLLEQLMSNAVKYTRQGSITIGLSEEKEALYIRDTGIGMEAEDLPRIFEKGFTGNNGRRDKKATGLGLYLCRQTAKQLSISLWAESAVGLGSTFYISLKQNPLEVE